MANDSILYLQANADVAAEVKKLFDDGEYEFLVADSAKAALDMMLTRDISLVLADCYLPDMRLIEFVTKVSKEYPGVCLNVCTDLRDITMVSQLMTMPSVKKILLLPWEISDIEDAVKSTLDEERIQRDLKDRSDDLSTRQEELDKKMDDLAEAMKLQQYSYQKLSAALNPLRDAFIRISDAEILSEEDLFSDKENWSKEKKKRNRYVTFITQACEKFLRIATTGSINTDNAAKIISEDLLKALKNASDVTIGSVQIKPDISTQKDSLLLIWYALWLVVRLQLVSCKKGNIALTMRHVTTNRIRLNVEVTGDFYNTSLLLEYEMFVKSILQIISNMCEITHEGDKVMYDMYFTM